MGIGQAVGPLHRLLNRSDIGLYIIFSHSDLRFLWSYARIARKTFPERDQNPASATLGCRFLTLPSPDLQRADLTARECCHARAGHL